MKWQEEARRVAWGIRRRALEHTINNNGGYLSQACTAAEILAVLYTKTMHLEQSTAPRVPLPFPGVPGATNPHYFTGAAYNGRKAPQLDRFYLSCVQYAMVLYAALVELDRMAPEALVMFNQDGSTVEMIGAEHSPGHELTSGSLGQTLSQVLGIALARRLKGETGRQWVLMSDGEFQSGQTWETVQALAFHKIANVGVIVDVNGQQCDGKMSDVMNIEPLHERLSAFGAHVIRVNGHDLEALAAAAETQPHAQPLFILADTDTAKDMPILEARKPKLHYIRFKSEAERKNFSLFLAEKFSNYISFSPSGDCFRIGKGNGEVKKWKS